MRLKKGNIIKLDFNPVKGHEQAGFRPAVVVSGNAFNENSSVVIVCPITNANNKYPLHVPLDDRTNTTGFVMADQIRTVCVNARNAKYIEDLPEDILDRVSSFIKKIIDDE
jgi:mRNA interferase MazF